MLFAVTSVSIKRLLTALKEDILMNVYLGSIVSNRPNET